MMLALDVNLIRDARNGNVHAFESLLEPLIDPAFRLAYAMLQDREEAADAVQDASIRAWRKVGQIRAGNQSMRPWFLAIVANQCRTTRRGRWRSVLRFPDLPLPTGSAEDLVVDHQDLRQALNQLPEGQRLALFLHFYLDLSLEEVASVLGVKPGGAKSKVHRALSNLRPKLDRVKVVV